MKKVTLQVWGRTLLLTAVMMVVEAFASSVLAQGYGEALVPFVVNVNATVSATNGTTQRQMSVTANQEAILRLPIQDDESGTQGVLDEAQRRINAPIIISNRNGKVILNLSAQSYKNAEVLLYTVNGKRILHSNVSASSAVNSISHPNLATGVYLLSIKGKAGNIVTSQLIHNGGGLNISVAFGGEDLSSSKRLAKEAASEYWTITVSAAGYRDTVYTLIATVGTNARQNITLRLLNGNNEPTYYTLTTNVTPSGGGSVSRSPNQTSYNSGTNVTVTATAAGGYTFTGWSGASTSTSSSVTITMSGDRTLTANFTQNNNTGGGGGSYESVVIGGKTWMKKNLNIETAGSWCYDNSSDSCAKYGRLYTWNAAKMACPTGWYLPSRSEWGELVKATGGIYVCNDIQCTGTGGKKLKSTSGWSSNCNGTDDFGFSALPGGYKNAERESFTGATLTGQWWTVTEYSEYDFFAYFWTLSGISSEGADIVHEDITNKEQGRSVRCVK